MDDLLSRHRKEQRDLVARITQKKKAASKKTRKGVNEECERLERELKERHAQELADLSDEATQEPDQEQDVLPNQEPGEEQLHQSEAPEANNVEKDMAKLDLKSETTNSQGRKPNRQKARLARRAAEQQRLVEEAAAEAKHMPDLRAQEKEAMKAAFKKHGVFEKFVEPNGHCLYAAVADQIQHRGDKLDIIPLEGKEEDYKVVRKVAANFIAKNPDDFVPFLEEDLDTYVVKVRDTGEWGGQVELMALARAYGLHICIVQGNGSVVDIGEGGDDKKIWLGYYKHSFGLGEHYNSLRPVPA